MVGYNLLIQYASTPKRTNMALQQHKGVTLGCILQAVLDQSLILR